MLNPIAKESGHTLIELNTALGRAPEDVTALALWLVGTPPGYEYNSFKIPKRKKGEYRLIEAPNEFLVKLQRTIYNRLLRNAGVSTPATGFVTGKSIVNNARPHVGKELIINIDLKDFFHSINEGRVYRFWIGENWGSEAATVLTRICCWNGRLPQGAPTSPALSNVVNRNLDSRLDNLAKKYRASYTRYADDLTFSFAKDDHRHRLLLEELKSVLSNEGYVIQKNKRVRIQRRHQRQVVTGLVVNEGVRLPRPLRNKIRAMLYQNRRGELSIEDQQKLSGYLALTKMVEGKIRAKKMKFVPKIGIITALGKEYLAVKTILDSSNEKNVDKLNKTCCFGTISCIDGKGPHKIILVEAGEGNNMSAICADQLIQAFPSIKTIIMVGIAGAIPNVSNPGEHVRLGDIVVSGRLGVVQYDYVTKKSDEEPRHPPRAPSATLLNRAQQLKREESEGKFPWLDIITKSIRIRGNEWKRPPNKLDVLLDYEGNPLKHPRDRERNNGHPKIFIGTIGSGNTLLKNPVIRDQLRERFSIRAVEMEASGVADAAWLAKQNISYFVIRGTVDYCDKSKNDHWHKYAALAAAAYLKSLLAITPTRSL